MSLGWRPLNGSRANRSGSVRRVRAYNTSIAIRAEVQDPLWRFGLVDAAHVAQRPEPHWFMNFALVFIRSPATTRRMPKREPTETTSRLEQLLAERILVLDGAMGTMVHAAAIDRSGLSRRAVRQPPEGSEELHRRPRRSPSPRRSRRSIGSISKPAPTSSRPTRSTPRASRMADFGFEPMSAR